MRWLLLLGLVAWSGLVQADGRMEVNQLCVSTGCFVGDAPGWPVTITESGSYVLTSNLVVPAGSAAIEIDVHSVRLDLGGHRVAGITQCTGALPTCTGAHGANGISVGTVNDIREVSIRNGTVTGFDPYCVRLFSFGSEVRDLQVAECTASGIIMLGPGRIDAVTVRMTGEDGVFGNNGVMVRDSLLLNNGGFGVNTAHCSGNVFNTNGDALGVAEENCLSQPTPNICNSGSCP